MYYGTHLVQHSPNVCTTHRVGRGAHARCGQEHGVPAVDRGNGLGHGVWNTVGVVSLIPQTLLRSECASINFVICKEAGEEPFEFTGPMLATFKATNDIAVFAVKQTVMRFTYLIGIPIDALISWKPPSAATAE